MFDEKKVLKALMTGRGIYGDVFSEERTYTHIQLESGKIEKLEKGEDKGVGLRVISPWKTFYASTNSFQEAHLVHLARELARFSGEKTVIKNIRKNILLPIILFPLPLILSRSK